MHIGLVIYGRLDSISGGFIYDRHIVEYLRRLGATVEVVSLPWRTYARQLTLNLDRRIWQRLRRARFDLLLQDELCHPSLFWINRRLRRFADYPLVGIVHHLRSSEARPRWQNSLYRLPERDYLRHLDGYIFNSETTRRVVSLIAGDSKPWVVANPAGDRLEPALTGAEVQARATATGPLQLLFLGNLIPRKGLHTLLQALAGLRDGGWQLHIAGDATVDVAYTRRVRQYALANGLSESIEWHGVLLDDRLADRMRRSHVLALPSTYEGFGIAYLEGMGFGLPALAGRSGAAPELISQGRNGFLIAPGDSSGLAGYIRQLHADRKLLAQMGQAALRSFQERPGWDDTGRRVFNFLQRLIPSAGDQPL